MICLDTSPLIKHFAAADVRLLRNAEPEGLDSIKVESACCPQP